MNQPMDVLREFPVRKGKQQKAAFRQAVQGYYEELGYDCQVEQGSFGVRNLVIGDPEQAKYLITAHYDTCAALPFPNLITPCSFWLFLGWQLLLVLILCLPAGIIGGIAGLLLGDPELCVPLAYLLLLAELALMLVGPANRHNSNDNTSGVVALLETARALPPEERPQVCFVLFDLEEAGLLGSMAYRKRHRKASARQLVLNLDCVGEGSELVLFPTKALKKDRTRMERFHALCGAADGRSITLWDRGFAVYPSDQANFSRGFGIAALCRSSWAGLYLSKIHTKHDKTLDETNIAVLRDFLLRAVRERA